MQRTAILVLMVVGPTPLAVGACGGDDSKRGTGKGDVVTKASRICRDATRDAQSYARSHAAPKQVSEVNTALEADQRIAEDAVSRLGRLDPPKPNTGFDSFVASQRRSAELYADEVSAAKASDPRRFGEVGRELLDETDRAKRSAKSAGMSDCPYQPVSVFYARATPDSPAPSTPEDSDVRGIWTGRVTQYGPGDTTARYRLRMKVTKTEQGVRAGSISYPGLRCAGELQLSRASGQHYVFRERITSGRNRCYDGGRITATVSGGSMSWRWVGSNNEVLGKLSRRG
jgi:hypothetical protein